jgi:hypothetical protein
MIPELIKHEVAKVGQAKLFGSRSMAARPATDSFNPSVSIGNRINISTDWDFSQEYSIEAHNYLASAGYRYCTRAVYFDDLTVGVYSKLIDTNNVHFVLHKKENLFRWVWDSISTEFYYKYLWKRSDLYLFESSDKVKITIRDTMNQLYKTGVL